MPEPPDLRAARLRAAALSPGRTRLQDLAGAVLAGGDPEDLLQLLVHCARTDLAARSAVLVLPLDSGSWSVEIVDGPDAAQLLGAQVDPDSALGRALATGDVRALDLVDSLPLLDQDGPARQVGIAVVDAADHGVGALVILPDELRETGVGQPAALSAVDRERLNALAALTGMILREATSGTQTEFDDERGRIARDLHDLAIQELFAVGMDLEGLTDALAAPGDPPSNTRIRTSVATSVQGIENAVAQIRQIVQSLRRERAEATITERLRHEVGLATAGLGFVPTLRLPPHPTDLDTLLPPEIAEDVVAVVREALANAARHAHSTAVSVSISVITEGVDQVVQVNVSDNGRGIDPSVTRRSGLANMSSRARRHVGWVDALSLDPGTMISWRVTLPAS